MRWTAMMAAAAMLALGATAAHADDDAARVLRLLGTGSGDAPKTYVLDLRLTAGDSSLQTDVAGWAASLDEGGGYGEVTGHCVESHCALTFHLGDGAMEIAADVGEGSGADGRFAFTKEEGAAPVKGVTHLSLVSGPLPVVGPLSAPDAITGLDLRDLLIWNGASAAFSASDPKEPPDSSLRESLAEWQSGKGLPPTGLIIDKDLAELRAGADANRATLGWTLLSDKAHSWSAGYPAKLLPGATTAGRERRYAGADGKALLVVALEPAMTEEAFDALVEKETADNDARSHVGYNRSNGDFELSYVEAGVSHLSIWHLREGGLARIAFTYPEDQAETYSLTADILSATFEVSDDFKAP
jgi:hypothetical protein